MSGIKLRTAGGGSVTLQPENTGVDVTLTVPADNSTLMSAADLAAGTGASLVGYTPAGTGAVATTVQAKLRETVSVLDFWGDAGHTYKVDPTGVLDSTYGIQSAVDASAGKTLLWPAGTYLITKAINCTDRGSTPTIWVGEGFNADFSSGTIVIARTAADGTLSPGWIADFTGSQNISISEMNFYGSGANAATKGLLFARTATYQYAQQVNLFKVCVNVATAPMATSVGSIALANNQAEQFVAEHCAFYADTPFVGMLNNEILLVSAYATISNAILSTTVLDFRQCTFMAFTKSAMNLYGVASSSWKDCVWARASGNTTLPAIVLDRSSTSFSYVYPQDLNIEGQVEGFPGGIVFNTAGMSAYRINTHLFMVAPSGGTAFVVTANNVALYNCKFDNHQTSNLSGYVAVSFGASNQIYAGEIFVYPGLTLSLNSVVNFGCRINYNGNGTGAIGITLGTNVTQLAAPNGANSYIDSEGYVCVAGVFQGTGVVNAGDTIGTLAAAHRPNRTVYGAAFVSGVGLTYCTITSGGEISIGTAMGVGTQVDLSANRFKQYN